MYKYNSFIKLYRVPLIFQRVKKVLKSPETATIFINVNRSIMVNILIDIFLSSLYKCFFMGVCR